MLTASPAAPAAAPEDFCLFAHLKPYALFRALTRGEAIVTVLALSLAVRLCLAAFMPFTADEAYAVVVSRSHALSYYDHPPMMFALARFMADMTQSETPFWLRLPFVLMGTASGAFLYDITRRCFSARAGLWATLAFQASPFFLTFGQLLIVPDGPLDLFLLISFWAMLPILLDGKSGVFNWVLAGAALALALLSKYQAVLFGVAALMALISQADGRRYLLQPACWLAFAVASLGLVPILLWNAQHGWISFVFQAGRAYHPTGLGEHAGNLAVVLVGQAIYLLPGVWFTGQKAIWRSLVGPGVLAPANRWLAILALVPILTFDLVALFGRHSLPHWAMSGFLFILPMVGDLRARAVARRSVTGRRFLVLPALVVPAIALIICLQSQTALLTRFGYTQAPRFDMGWQNLTWSAEDVTLGNGASFIVTSDWVQAGHAGLAFGAAHPIEVVTDPHQFQFIDQARLKTMRRGYYVVAQGLGQAPANLASVNAALAGRYRVTGRPISSLQYRMGYPSFRLIIVPVARR